MVKVIDVQSTRYVGTWPAALCEPKPDSAAHGLWTIGEIARNAVEELLREKPRLLNDTDLSDEGRRKKLAALARAKAEKLVELRPRVNGAMDDARRMEHELAGTAAPIANDAAGAIREAEIRTWFRGLGESERLGVLRAASDSDDYDTLRAVYSGPRAMNLIPETLRPTVEQALLRGKDPEKLQRMRDLRLAARYADEALSFAKAAILREGGIEPTLADRVRPAS